MEIDPESKEGGLSGLASMAGGGGEGAMEGMTEEM
jgi:hypothetical protein